MISVIIPAQNAAPSLPAVFRSLFDAAMDGLVSEVILCDCGSTDGTLEIADAAGATIIKASYGQQLLAGAQAARKSWLLFLHAGAVLDEGWEDEVRAFITQGEMKVAAFRVRNPQAKLFDFLIDLKGRVFGTAGSCPALIIHAKLLNSVGAFASTPPIDGAGIARKLGRHRTFRLKARVKLAAFSQSR
jgi:glycosyltransferase involved in cell wall biosynthesis